MKEYMIDEISAKMVLLDYVPVLFFVGCIFAVYLKLNNTIFLVGGILCTVAGLSKASWKLVLAQKNKNIFFLNRIFRIFMCIGFTLIGISIFLSWSHITIGNLTSAVTGFPQIIFFAITIIGLIFMCVCAAKQDHSKKNSNWMEEIINTFSQGSLLIGVLISCGYIF